MVAASLVASESARAESVEVSNGVNPSAERLLSGFAALDRPHGIIEGNVGVLTLPAAEVCVERSTGCKEGDLSFALEAWPLYRANVDFAFGAGVVLGLIPTAHPPHDDPPGIERDQTRSYFTFEGTARYYPVVAKSVEWWLGLTGGLVVVNDTFKVVTHPPDDRALLGTSGVAIRTEGGTVGVATGFAYELTPHWSFIGTARYSRWFLPVVPATDPLGDEASLIGENSVVSGAFGVGYRLPL